MSIEAQIWVTCVATLEIPCGPYDMRTNFRDLVESCEREAREKLRLLQLDHANSTKPRVIGLPKAVGFRATVESADQGTK